MGSNFTLTIGGVINRSNVGSRSSMFYIAVTDKDGAVLFQSILTEDPDSPGSIVKLL